MSLNAPLLRASLEIVVARQPEITPRFYEILFERYPQVKPLFGRNSSANQARMLQDAIVAVVDHVEDAEWLTTTLHAMGRKHVDYGVTEPMYAYVGDALLATLAEHAGEAWTPDVATAWTDAYTAISSLMIAGSRTA
jgi:hemoglobin-like flavoprotein